MIRVKRRHLAFAALAAALALPASGTTAGEASGLPTAIGKGEGKLVVIEWPAYTDPSFAKAFEAKTGCKIQRKDAGSSNQMVDLMHTGGGGGGGQGL
jgi:spermidine/putrescine-binding protein